MTNSEEIDAQRLMRLHNALKESSPRKPGNSGKVIAHVTPDELRAYKTESKRESRQRQREAVAKGAPEPTTANARLSLADAAIMILAAGGPVRT